MKMKVRFLKTSEPGAYWFRAYYRKNPQLDVQKARNSYRIAKTTLATSPFSGGPFEGHPNVRKYDLIGTHFSFLYTVARDTVWIIDIRDHRGLRSADALRRYSQELRSEFGIEIEES